MTAPVPHGKDYVSAVTWIRIHDSQDTLWTQAEVKEDPSRQPPPFLQLRCHSGILRKHRLQRRPARFANLMWDGHWSNTAVNLEYGRPCQVIGRRRIRTHHRHLSNKTSDTIAMTVPDSYEYDVVVQAIHDDDTWEMKEVKKFSIPRRLLKWFDEPYTTDVHLTLAFRNPLGLPDEMVSTEWRNRNGGGTIREPRADTCPSHREGQGQ